MEGLWDVVLERGGLVREVLWLVWRVCVLISCIGAIF